MGKQITENELRDNLLNKINDKHTKTEADARFLAKSAKAESAKVADSVHWNNVAGKPDTSQMVGPQGPIGPKGDKGDKGDTGATGASGAAGPTGPIGPKGATGDRGATGAQGPKGDKGDRGDVGPAGPAGAQGPAGPKGSTGATGTAGAPGAQGPKGDTGATGPKGADGLTTRVTVNGNTYNQSGGTIALPAYPTLASLGASADGHRHTSMSTARQTNLNSYMSSGFFDAENPQNGPAVNGWLWGLKIQHGNEGYGGQLVIGNGMNKMFFRSQDQTGEGAWHELYHTGKKPTAGDVGAFPSNGGTLNGSMAVNGQIVINGENNIKLPHNYGITGKEKNNGVDRYMLFMNANNQVTVGYNNENIVLLACDAPIVNGGHRIYHQNFKPSPHEIDALSMSSGGTVRGTSHFHDITILSNWYHMTGGGVNFGFGIGGEDVYLHNNRTNRALQLQHNGNLAYAGSFISSSDKRVKENIVYLDSAKTIAEGELEYKFVNFIKSFAPVTYSYKGTDINKFGFIAQDVANTEIGSLFVSEEHLRIKPEGFINDEGVRVEEKDCYETSLMYDLGGYTSVVARALQEEIFIRESKIAELEARLAKIESLLSATN